VPAALALVLGSAGRPAFAQGATQDLRLQGDLCFPMGTG
jgi:hypothetical protein